MVAGVTEAALSSQAAFFTEALTIVADLGDTTTSLAIEGMCTGSGNNSNT